LERLVDQRLTPLLVRSLAGAGDQEPRSILIRVDENQLRTEVLDEKTLHDVTKPP